MLANHQFIWTLNNYNSTDNYFSLIIVENFLSGLPLQRLDAILDLTHSLGCYRIVTIFFNH